MLPYTLYEWLFWITMSGIAITYFVYPLVMVAFDTKKSKRPALANPPEVTILFAAYNEEEVIVEKIQSIFETHYPKEKIKVLIGTDACTDTTDELIDELKEQYSNITHVIFQDRTGKPGILNALAPLVTTPIIVCTDANVIFQATTLNELIVDFQDEKVGLVAGNIQYGSGKAGIAKQERTYLKFENQLKLAESNRFGMAMGAEGGIYAVRQELFPQFPKMTIVDDFYVSMTVLKAGYKLIFAPDAIGIEDVSIESKIEFNRKARISAGNWQNLGHFGDVITSDFFPLGAVFLFHKVLRWFTPFFLLIAFVTALLLMTSSLFYAIFAALASGILLLLFIENGMGIALVKSTNWKYINHFIWMNLALLTGFIRYLKGIKTNIWQRTERNER